MGWLLHCDNGSLRKHKPSVPCSALLSNNYVFFLLFFYLGFLSRTFTVHETAGEGGGYLFNSSLLLPPASQALRHQPGDYCRGLTSAHSWQPDSNREPLVSERKSLTTKLRALCIIYAYLYLLGEEIMSPCRYKYT